jgi:hypothetical protein
MGKSFTTQAEIIFLPEEVIMKKRNFLIGMLAMTLVFGMAGCAGFKIFLTLHMQLILAVKR